MERQTALTFGLYVAITSLLCQLISFGCPGWCIIEKPVHDLARLEHFIPQSVVYVNMALWYVIIRVEDFTFTKLTSSSTDTSTYHEIFGKRKSWQPRIIAATCDMNKEEIVAAEVEATIALLVCCLGVLLTIVKYRAESRIQSTSAGTSLDKVLVSSMLLLLVSGVLLLVPVGQMSWRLMEYKRRMSVIPSQYDVGSIEIPYGLIIAGGGGCLTVIASLFLFVVCCTPLQLNGTADNTIPMMPIDNQETVSGQAGPGAYNHC